MYFLIILGAGYRLFMKRDPSATSDNMGFAQFSGLLVALGAVIVLTHPK
jgi:hypothetical protein